MSLKAAGTKALWMDESWEEHSSGREQLRKNIERSQRLKEVTIYQDSRKDLEELKEGDSK